MVKLAGRADIANALRLLADHYEAGTATAFSAEATAAGTARVSAIYAHGTEDIEMPGIVPEDDE